MARRKTSIMRKPCCPQNCTSDKAGIPEPCGDKPWKWERNQRAKTDGHIWLQSSHLMVDLVCEHETRSVTVSDTGEALTAWRSCLRLSHSVREAAVVERRKEPCLQEEHISWRNSKSIKLWQESQQEVCVHLADLSSRVRRGWWYVEMDLFSWIPSTYLDVAVKPGGAGP